MCVSVCAIHTVLGKRLSIYISDIVDDAKQKSECFFSHYTPNINLFRDCLVRCEVYGLVASFIDINGYTHTHTHILPAFRQTAKMRMYVQGVPIILHRIRIQRNHSIVWPKTLDLYRMRFRYSIALQCGRISIFKKRNATAKIY